MQIPPRIEGESAQAYHERLQALRDATETVEQTGAEALGFQDPAGLFEGGKTKAVDLDPEMLRHQAEREAFIGEQLSTEQPGKAFQIVQKCIRNGEPFFVFRAKDILSIQVLAYYAELVEKLMPSDHEFASTIADQQELFLNWQRSHMDQVRYPD